MIEEMKNPKRDLPIAIVFSCLVVTACYTLCNVAYFTTVDAHEILTTPAVAVVSYFFGLRSCGKFLLSPLMPVHQFKFLFTYTERGVCCNFAHGGMPATWVFLMRGSARCPLRMRAHAYGDY